MNKNSLMRTIGENLIKTADSREINPYMDYREQFNNLSGHSHQPYTRTQPLPHDFYRDRGVSIWEQEMEYRKMKLLAKDRQNERETLQLKFMMGTICIMMLMLLVMGLML